MEKLETRAVDKRMRFVTGVEAGEETVTALCRRFGFSRKTGYKWLERYLRKGSRAGGAVAGAARAPASGDGGDRRALPCGTLRASDLGAGQGARLARAARSRDGLAGSEHDRRAVRPRRTDGAAQAAPPLCALERTVRCLRRPE